MSIRISLLEEDKEKLVDEILDLRERVKVLEEENAKFQAAQMKKRPSAN